MVERAVYRAKGPKISRIRFNPFVSPWAAGLTSPRSSGSRIGGLPPGPGGTVVFQEDGRAQGRDAGLAPETVSSLPGLPLADLAEKPLKEALLALEQYRMASALDKARYNQKKAAALLGLTYDQFRGLKKKHRTLKS